MGIKTEFVFGNSGICTVARIIERKDILDLQIGQVFRYEYKKTSKSNVFHLVDTKTGKRQYLSWVDFKKYMEVKGYGKVYDCTYTNRKRRPKRNNRGKYLR